MKEQDRILNILELLADEVSKDLEAANEFLSSEGVDAESLFEEKMGPLLDRIRDFKLQSGKKKEEVIQAKFNRFLEKTKNLNRAQIIELYPQLSETQAAFSKLSDKGLSEKEIDQLIKDGGFLSFLESLDDNDISW